MKFPDNRYDWDYWEVEKFQSPNRLQEFFNQLHLSGCQIEKVKTVGLFFDSPLTFWSPNKYCQKNTLDEPLLIHLGDGRELEICYSDGSTVKAGVNTLPAEVKSAYKKKQNTAFYFSNLNGSTIKNVVVHSTTEYPEFTGAHGEELSEEQDAYIEGISFELTNGLTLHLTNYYDYCAFEVKNADGELVELEGDKVKKIKCGK